MDNEEWELIGHFSRYRIMASGEKRRLEDPDTGKIIREYTVPVFKEPDNQSLPDTESAYESSPRSTGLN